MDPELVSDKLRRAVSATPAKGLGPTNKVEFGHAKEKQMRAQSGPSEQLTTHSCVGPSRYPGRSSSRRALTPQQAHSRDHLDEAQDEAPRMPITKAGGEPPP